MMENNDDEQQQKVFSDQRAVTQNVLKNAIKGACLSFAVFVFILLSCGLNYNNNCLVWQNFNFCQDTYPLRKIIHLWYICASMAHLTQLFNEEMLRLNPDSCGWHTEMKERTCIWDATKANRKRLHNILEDYWKLKVCMRSILLLKAEENTKWKND